MVKNIPMIIFPLLFSLIQAIHCCNVLESKWNNFTSKIVNVEPVATSIKHAVAGSVKIVSDCTFTVRNMTIIPTGNGVYWYGIPVKNDTDPYPRVVLAALGSFNGQTITFSLDPQYSFDDISIMEIRSEGDNRAYGAFAVQKDVLVYYGINKQATLDENKDVSNPFRLSSSSSRVISTSNMSLFWAFMPLLLLCIKISV